MMQKIKNIFLLRWRAVISGLQTLFVRMASSRKKIGDNWKTFVQKSKNALRRDRILWVMGGAEFIALAYFAYASPAFWPVLYLLWTVFVVCAFVIRPAGEESPDRQLFFVQTRWKIALSISLLFSIYFQIVPCGFWELHWRFISLDLLAVPTLLFVQQAWPETWRDNRWLIIPAVLIALWWMNSAWLVTYETSQKWQVRDLYKDDPQLHGLRVLFPSYVPYDASEAPSLDIWCDVSIDGVCANRQVTLWSEEDSMLFSEDTQPPVWKSRLTIQLNPRGEQQTILLQRRVLEPKPRYSLIIDDEGSSKRIGTITFESQSGAYARNYWLTLLQGGNVAVTLIGAVYAGLKQWDEQKKKEDKELQRELVGKIKAAGKGDPDKIVQTVQVVYEKLDTIRKWNQSEKREIAKAFSDWMETIVSGDQVGLKNWHKKISSGKTAEFLTQTQVVLHFLELKKEDEFFNLREVINQTSPDYSWSTNAGRYPPERYPLRNAFRQLNPHVLQQTAANAQYLEDTFALKNNPFRDWRHPLGFENAQEEETDQADLPLLEQCAFSFSENRFSGQNYYFLSDWDVLAALYAFCVDFRQIRYRSDSQKTFFVPVMPENWHDELSLQSYLLSCLAERWLEILLLAPHGIGGLRSSEQEHLAALLLWRYRSVSVIRRKIQQGLAEKNISAYPAEHVGVDFWTLLENSSGKQIPAQGQDLRNWMALRPLETCQTLFLCADASFSPDGAAEEWQAQVLRSLSDDFANDMVQAGVYLVRFLKAHPFETINKTAFENTKKWLDSRVSICSSPNAAGTFLALFPTLEIDALVAKASGSPGKVVKMAHDLLEPYLNGKDPGELNFIDSDTLLARLDSR